MKKILFGFLFLGVCMPVYSSDAQLEKYISTFDYAARKEMKRNQGSDPSFAVYSANITENWDLTPVY